MSHLEENARLSHELQQAMDRLAGITRQRDELQSQLTKALEQNCDLRKKCQRLSESIEERRSA